MFTSTHQRRHAGPSLATRVITFMIVRYGKKISDMRSVCAMTSFEHNRHGFHVWLVQDYGLVRTLVYIHPASPDYFDWIARCKSGASPRV